MAALEELAALLETAGVAGGDSGWALFLGFLPDGPDAALCLFETTGPAPDSRWAVEYPGFQLRVRGPAAGYAAARAKLEQARAVLHGGEAGLGAGWAYLHAAQSGALPLGRDAANRPGFVLNFIAMRRTG